MSSKFQPHYLSCDSKIGMWLVCISKFFHADSNIVTSHWRLYSTILAEFPWYSESLVLKPESLLAHSDKIPEFKACLHLCWQYDWVETMNRHSYLHYMGSRMRYFLSLMIHIPKIFWGCWAWRSSQPQNQNRAVYLRLHMNLIWVSTTFKSYLWYCPPTGFMKLFASVHNAFPECLPPPLQHICSCQGHRVWMMIFMWVCNSC